jgi:hypothetical protein
VGRGTSGQLFLSKNAPLIAPGRDLARRPAYHVPFAVSALCSPQQGQYPLWVKEVRQKEDDAPALVRLKKARSHFCGDNPRNTLQSIGRGFSHQSALLMSPGVKPSGI